MEVHSTIFKQSLLNSLKLYYHFFLFKLFGEKKKKKNLQIRFKVFPATIKSINPTQKYPHIIESYVCILKIFFFMFLLLINVFIPFGICSTPKESK